MRKKLLIILFFFNLIAFAQDNLSWKSINSREITPNKTAARDNFASEFSLYQVPVNDIQQKLKQSPNRLITKISNVIISIPNISGQMERFQMFEFSNFDPQLQAQFPEIRSYVGIGLDDKHAKIRMSSDPSGMQGMIFRADKTNEFFEPYSIDRTIYAVYESSRNKGELPFVCSTEDKAISNELNRQSQTLQRSSSGELLTFRLALSCNGEYTQFFGGTVAQALAAMNATLTRVNGVFEKDLAIHMDLIPNNNVLVYTNPANDPYTTIGNWNAQLQSTLTNVIGEANYDIGHMFGSNGGGGSAGCIGCVCDDGIKGSGKTAPSNGVPAGDTFDIDFVIHEMGHQLGANHTYSHIVEGSGVNVEPGSGSTIMGYAGITSRDVQANSNAYFVYASIKQIQDNMIGKTCPVRVNLSNNTPTANAGLDYTIPKSTPFILTGQATDADGDALTYCWEQNDSATTEIGAQSAASSTKVGGPNWRSFTPTTSPSRYFPQLSRVIANSSTTLGLEIITEALSSVARTLNFVFTVRDNFAGAGQTNSDAMTVTVNGTAGPFTVSSPNTAVSWIVGSNQNVTWNVAGTTANGVNAEFVDIYLSTNGGNTFPILLASKVPNDGSEVVTVPNNVGTANRVMIQGYKHIFYDMSNTNFTITAPTSDFGVSFNRLPGEQNKDVCTGSSVSYVIDYATYAGFSGNTTFAVSGEPAGSTVTFSPSSISGNGTVTMTISNLTNSTPNFYSMVVTAISGATIKTVPFYADLLNSNFATSVLVSPANNAIGQNVNLNLTWQTDLNATQYQVQVATDENFTNIVTSGTSSTTSFNVAGLAQATAYYWRISPANPACSGVFSAPNLFKTGQITCTDFTSVNIPITISSAPNVTVNSTLNIPTTGVISDVNASVTINHTYVNDITVTLISPSGTQVQLLARPCTEQPLANINATFNDTGTALVCGSVSPVISGNVIPTQTLSAFNGQQMSGNWTLRVLDSIQGDGGAITGWSLNICNITAVPLGVNDNSLQNFALYPNPNTGSFTISFTSNNSEKVTVGVFDIQGRSVFNKQYQNNGLFNENMQVDNIQSGVYLVKVQNGSKQLTKKIVIE
ncbi:reprolysin-like metallopeptidase [Flavobacterium dankookense]|uniref:Putative secreted protein (Por secretion system target) n=1 Tax=Flavobacterium dankookense TaxID=706186 RepID=A0A4V3CS02_9FLAO|nr:zinc-dependent metalloprotease family protein [Flavobacterium dankookense]TDP58712.1 putative secreted protein (Por secretion system target) [Flavobacterium dankookense]